MCEKSVVVLQTFSPTLVISDSSFCSVVSLSEPWSEYLPLLRGESLGEQNTVGRGLIIELCTNRASWVPS